MSFKNDALAYLKNYVNMMEFTGENKFKVNAFRGAITTIKKLDIDLEDAIRDNSITKVKGIGKGIQNFLNEFLLNGKVNDYDSISGSIPEGIIEVLNIRGLGVKKVKLLYDSLKISNIDDLMKACENNSILKVKGFTEHSKQNILQEIENIEKYSKFMLLNHAEHDANVVLDQLSKFNSVSKVEITGELRRCNEIISRIELVVLATDINDFNKRLLTISKYKTVNTNTSCNIYQLEHKRAVDVILYVCTENEEYWWNLFLITGAQGFVEANGFNRTDIAYKSELDIFKSKKLKYVIPEMREAQYHDAPSMLSSNSDLDESQMSGLIHFHTTYSDGVNSLEEMHTQAENNDFKFMVVCDHSKSAFYANGLSEVRILEQREDIIKLNSKGGIKKFHGIEADILNDGSLDYNNDVLSEFDLVVASIHSNFNLSEDEMTTRMIKAIENPYTDILAHPTGRLLLSREPYKVDIKKLLEACSKNDVTVEINASPHRLDLDWRNIYYARELGCKFAINPDAHSTKGIEDIKYGVRIGRKGGLMSKEVINYLSVDEFKKYLNRKVKRNFN